MPEQSSLNVHEANNSNCSPQYGTSEPKHSRLQADGGELNHA
jgi:hypothetical protein